MSDFFQTEADVVTDTDDDVISCLGIKERPIYLAVKRCFDILLSLLSGCILLFPMLVIAIIICIDTPGPAIFKQKRIGKNGKAFTIYKFRTMKLNAPPDLATNEFSDSNDYITKIGAFLRRTSIDELPQLINIFLGTMSFVGYRPVCLTETKLNGLREKYGVFIAKPGLTGLAQVSGRDNMTIEKKAIIDADYVRRRSFRLDLWCVLKTVIVIFSGEGNK